MEEQNNGRKLLTVLSFSGGVQSSALLWMYLRGTLPRPKHFLVLSADPGMENTHTYAYVKRMQEQCAKAGVEAVTAPGPNLYEDLINLKESGKTRFDNPPYWTFDDKGKRGRLMQRCTGAYKIAPMDRYVRRKLFELHGIGVTSKRLPGYVEKIIGFSNDEQHRVSEPKQNYVKFRYPLIDLKMSKSNILAYFKAIGEAPPPRSVCNACFANDAASFREMAKHRPADFSMAVKVDEAVRDLSQIKVNDRVFVSSTGVPLRDLVRADKDVPDLEDWSCDSGHCFI